MPEIDYRLLIVKDELETSNNGGTMKLIHIPIPSICQMKSKEIPHDSM